MEKWQKVESGKSENQKKWKNPKKWKTGKSGKRGKSGNERGKSWRGCFFRDVDIIFLDRFKLFTFKLLTLESLRFWALILPLLRSRDEKKGGSHFYSFFFTDSEALFCWSYYSINLLKITGACYNLRLLHLRVSTLSVWSRDQYKCKILSGLCHQSVHLYVYLLYVRRIFISAYHTLYLNASKRLNPWFGSKIIRAVNADQISVH